MISVRRLVAKYRLGGESITALDGIDVEVPAGEVFVLLGPSGCGKTTLLRCLAGLEKPAHGQIEIDGTALSDAETGLFIAPEDRPLAMVFQSYAMWPHMNVFDNVAFPLRAGRRRIESNAVDTRVGEVLDLLGIGHLSRRPVTALSGGQQQRVGLARALALQPKVLLMDEPLSNLDFRLQVELRGQLRSLMHELGLTTVHVTHNQAEALEMGDRIAVMDRGHVVQTGDPMTIFRRPINEHVARFVGDMNLLPGTFAGTEGNYGIVETAVGRLQATVNPAATPSNGAPCLLGIRPADVILPAGPEDTAGRVTATVAERRYQGDRLVYRLEVNGCSLEAAVHHTVDLDVGASVAMTLRPDRAIAVMPSKESDNGTP